MIRATTSTAGRRVSSSRFLLNRPYSLHFYRQSSSQTLPRQSLRLKNRGSGESQRELCSLPCSITSIETSLRKYSSCGSTHESSRETTPHSFVSYDPIGMASAQMPQLSLFSTRGLMLMSKQVHGPSSMSQRFRYRQIARFSRTPRTKRVKRVKRRNAKPSVSRRSVLRKATKRPSTRAKRRKPVHLRRKQTKRERLAKQRFVPKHIRVQQRVKKQRKAAAADAAGRRWTRVENIAGASSALIEKYAVPPIQTIRKLATVPTITKGDLLSVMAVLSLLMTILVTPFTARYIWKSESEDYEELEWDDPVAQADKDFRRHVDKELGESLRLYMLEELRKAKERRLRNKDNSLQKTQGDTVPDDTEPVQARPKKVPKSILNTEGMLKEILESEILLNVVTHFVAQVIESERVNDALQGVLRRLWKDLVNDPETTSQVVQLLYNGIQNKEIKRSVRKLVLELINDKEVYSELQHLLIRLGNEQEVLGATQELLTESAHKALNDPEILDHSMAFATDVVGDDVVQRTSGEALRNTVSYAVRPGLSAFFALVGVALILFSFSALGQARSSDKEAEMLERAFSTMARSVQESTVSGVSTILSLPGRILSACVSAVVAIVKAPFQLVSGIVSGISKAGNATSRAVSSAVASVIALPAMLVQAFSSFLARAGRSVSNELSNTVRGLSSAIAASFLGSAVRAVVDVSVGAVSALSSGVSAALKSVSSLGHAISAGSSSLLRAFSKSVTVIGGRIVEEWYHIGSLAAQVLAQTRGMFVTGAKYLGLTTARVETMVAAVSSFLDTSITVVSEWIERILGRDAKPDTT